jgi:membrane protease YdiL (CAAX protease family)
MSWRRGPSRAPALSESVSGLLIASGIELSMFGTVFALAWIASRATRDDLLLRWRPGWWVLPLGMGYSVAIRLALGVVLLVASGALVLTGVVSQETLQEFTLKNRPEVETIVDVDALKKNPVYFALTLTLISFVVAGLREELWRVGFLAGLRVVFPRVFASRRGEVLGVVLIAIIFGIAHVGMGVLAAVMAGILGVFLGIIMIVHRSIWPAVLAHGFFDATSMALLPWISEKLQQMQ